MKALVFERNLPRFAAARLSSSFGAGRGAALGPLRLTELEPPDIPREGWHRVRPVLSGICGSDIATVDGRSSRYFEELVSFPFVPGHEVVGELEDNAVDKDGSPLQQGTRVVIEPVLACPARGIHPPCRACAAGRFGNCERVSMGHIRPGIQTGFCTDTGGGWSAAGLVAHQSQLHAVPDALSDGDAVVVEPLACGVHAALSPQIGIDDTVAVIGAGTVGLTVVAALDYLAERGLIARPRTVLVGARYRHQRSLSQALGAIGLPADKLSQAVRRESGSLAVGSPNGGPLRLTGGADVVFDCVGSEDSISQALAMVRPRGQVVLVGMPGKVHLDLAPLWHREIHLLGSYTYGLERRTDLQQGGDMDHGPTAGQEAEVESFDLAFDLAAHLAGRLGPGRLVSAAYPLDRFEEALLHAGNAGRRGAVKVVFELQQGKQARTIPIHGRRNA